MAFRGYELNLIMRVQDRASSRLRRVASDLGGMNRAAQMQRDAARLAQNARSASGRAEQRIAAQRLQGLSESTAQLKLFNSQLGIAVQRGRLTRIEAEKLAHEYQRIIALQRASATARTVTHAGSVAAFTGGIGIAALGGAANAFANFNRQSVKAATQMRGVNESFDSTIRVAGILQTGILDLTRQFPASATEMADSAFQIASGMDFAGNSVQRYNQSFRLLRAANKVAVAGFTDLESATDTMITTFNNFDPELRNVNSILNTLFAIVRFGRGDFTQFTALFGGVASAAKGAGQPLVEAGSALAFLTTRLPRPEAAASYRRLIQILGQPRFIAGFEKIFGEPITVRVDGVEKLRPLSEIINTIVSKSPSLAKGGTDLQNLIQTITATGQEVLTGRRGQGLQGTEQARRGLVNLVSGWKQYRNILANVTADTDEFDRAFEAASATPGVQWEIALNQFKAFAIIVGQEVLPVLIRFIEWLGKAAHWFEDLNPRTRHLIGQFLAWGSAIALVGGVLAVLIGAIARLVIGFRILRMTSENSGKSLSGLTRTLGMLGALGAIAIVFKVLWTGDATAVDFISGALAGAAAGFAVGGPLGALIGGITVPITLKVIEESGGVKVNNMQKAAAELARDIQNNDLSPVFLNKKTFSRIATEALRLGEITQRQYIAGMKQAGFSEEAINAQMARFIHDRRPHSEITGANKKTTQTILEQWRELSASLTGLDVFKGLNMQAATQAAELQVMLARAQAGGDTAKIRAALEAQIKFDQSQIKRLEGMKKTAETQKQLIQLYKALAEAQNELNSMQAKGIPIEQQLNLARAEALGNVAQQKSALSTQVAWYRTEIARLTKLPQTIARQQQLLELWNNLGGALSKLKSLTGDQKEAEKALASETLRAAEAAREDRINKINQAADNLVNKYKELKDANKEAFGIFEGPISQGPIAQIFDNINQTLTGFGAKPIAIPISLQVQDISAQIRNFEMFRRGLDTLQRRGAPAELIAELQGKGVEAIPLIEGLRRAGPGAFRNYVAMWKRSQKLIETSTKKDMDNTLKMWKSYGSSIAWQIVQGLSSDKAQATLREGYKKLIVSTFGAVLKTEMNKQIAAAVAQWKKQNPTTQTPVRNPATARTGTTRQMQAVTNNTYNDNYTVHADGATPTAVRRAIDQTSFQKRRKRRTI